MSRNARFKNPRTSSLLALRGHRELSGLSELRGLRHRGDPGDRMTWSLALIGVLALELGATPRMSLAAININNDTNGGGERPGGSGNPGGGGGHSGGVGASSASGASGGGASSPRQYGGDACKSACGEYNQARIPGPARLMSMAYITQPAPAGCGPLPGGGKPAPSAGTGSIHVNRQGESQSSHGAGTSAADQGIDPNLRTGDAQWDSCFASVQSRWLQLGQYCDAIEAADDAKDPEWLAMTVYGAAAITCGAACAVGLGGVNLGMTIACTSAAGGAVATDLIGKYAFMRKYGEVDNWTEGTTYGAAGTVAGGAAFAPSAVAQKIGPCFAAAALAMSAASRRGAIVGFNHTQDSACTSLMASLSDSATVDPGAASSGADSSAAAQRPSRPVAANVSARSGMGGGNGSGGLSSNLQKALRELPGGPQFAQATAGDTFLPLYDSISDKGHIADTLKQAAGLTVEDLARRLARGESVSQIAASSPATAGIAGVLAKAEKDAASLGPRSTSLLASSGSFTRGGSGGGAKGTSNPFGMFGGMKSPIEGSGAPSETSFERAKRELASSESSGDIWHEGFGGTIFQIVSHKLDRARERVDQLEWESPLNRALTGLPARRPASKR